SKAFSCMGGFVTCAPELKLLLKMKSDTYLFGGPVPPPYLEAVCVVCDILMSPEYERLVGRLRELVRRFAHGARELGYHVLGDQSPIVSILLSNAQRTFSAGKWLFDRGYYVQSVTFPAVPFNRSLLRIQINANHPPQAIDGLLNALSDLRSVVGIQPVKRSVAM